MKIKILGLSIALLAFAACGSSETEEAKQTDSTVMDESAPKLEEEINSTDEVTEETSSTEAEKTEDDKTSAVNPSFDQRDPERLMEVIFEAAESGDYTGLDLVCAPDADGDCKSICSIASADAKKKEEFKQYFSTGMVTNTEIHGKNATIDFKFGPGGAKKETMKLVLLDGKWFIQSF